MSFPVNKTKSIIAAAVAVFFCGFGLYYLFEAFWIGAIVFLVIGIIFGYVFFKNASRVSVKTDALTLSFFGKVIKKVSWDEIREVGLIGENVFSRRKEKTGDKYIYFSPQKMTEQERFQMIVKWPPKDMIYMEYGEKQLETVMSIWTDDLKVYNAADVFPDSEEEKEDKNNGNSPS